MSRRKRRKGCGVEAEGGGAGVESVTVSPFPPFVGLNIRLPRKAMVADLLGRSGALRESAGCVAWALREILEDQFAEGDARGAWSRQYEAYNRFLYEEEIPSDVSTRDTISFSAWAVLALSHYAKAFPHEELVRAVHLRLGEFVRYLKRHYDPRKRGFGRLSPTSRNPRNVAVDLRHTAWAVLSILELEPEEEWADIAVRDCGKMLREEVERLLPGEERGITCAVLHRLLSDRRHGMLVTASERKRTSFLRRLEAGLADRFDVRYSTWDTDKDPPDRAGIDNALFVLYTVEPATCVGEGCRRLLKQAMHAVLRQHVVEVGRLGKAVPFHYEGAPSVATTSLLTWILTRSKAFHVPRKTLKGLISYVTHASTREGRDQHHYPWQLSGLLELACH